jgi:hypothetical protein
VACERNLSIVLSRYHQDIPSDDGIVFQKDERISMKMEYEYVLDACKSYAGASRWQKLLSETLEDTS